MESHKSKTPRSRNPISSLKRSQQFTRTKEEIQKIKKTLFEAPETVQKSMWNSIVKDCPYYYDKINQNPRLFRAIMHLNSYNISIAEE